MKGIGLSFAAALALAAAAPQAQAQDVVTACYKESAGTLKKFAVGDVPSKPCKVGKEEEVSLLMASSLCGDGALGVGEQCDDGNVDPNDGCSGACAFEGGACGDGAIGIGEQCDDGNAVSNDGCSDDCTFEAGACGDGNVNLSEQCDDSNSVNGDGCSEQCLGEGSVAEIPFYVVLDADNSEATIATHGEFKLFARCRVNNVGNDRISIFVTRTSAGWHTDNTGAVVQAADALVEMSFRQGVTGVVGITNDFDEGYAIGPDGTYLAFDADGTVLANNVFGHKCMTAGIVRTMTGFIPEVPVP